MTKLHQILIGLLAAQLVAAVIVFWPRPAPAADQPLLGDLKVEDIVRLTVEDNTGNRTVLAKNSAGAWAAAEAADYPADAAKIAPVLAKLAGIKASRLIAQTAASQTQLEVADGKFQRRIELQTAAGAAGPGATQTLFLGTSAGSSSTHVRLAGANEVYLANNLSTWEVNADLLSWIDSLYFSVPVDDISALAIRNANGEFRFTKDSGGAWVMEGLQAGETLNANNVTSLVNQVAAVRLTRPLGRNDDPAYGLAQPSAVVTVTYKSGEQQKTSTLTFGAKDATDNSYVLKSSDSEYYVRVADYVAQTIVERQRDGFLQTPPTPAP